MLEMRQRLVPPYRNRFLDAVWKYHHDHSSSEVEIFVSKKVFDLVMQDKIDQAREVAQTTPATKAIFAMVDNPEGAPEGQGKGEPDQINQ